MHVGFISTKESNWTNKSNDVDINVNITYYNKLKCSPYTHVISQCFAKNRIWKKKSSNNKWYYSVSFCPNTDERVCRLIYTRIVSNSKVHTRIVFAPTIFCSVICNLVDRTSYYIDPKQKKIIRKWLHVTCSAHLRAIYAQLFNSIISCALTALSQKS